MINKIRVYKSGIKRNYDVIGNQYYITNGESENTTWFKTYKDAKNALKQQIISDLISEVDDWELISLIEMSKYAREKELKKLSLNELLDIKNN